MTYKFEEHYEWLLRAYNDRYISKDVYEKAYNVSVQVHLFNGLVPASCTGPDLQVEFYWNKNEHHLSIDFIDGDVDEYYYCNRLTDHQWYEEGKIPEKFWEYLEFFDE